MGTYGIKEQMRSGWISLSSPQRGPFEVDTSGDPIGPINFVNFDLGYISGHKWNDLDGDGEWDGGEPPIMGWKIYAEYPDGSIHYKTTTSTGFYSFPDLGPGTYRVFEDMSEHPGWVQTAPAGNEYLIPMTSDAAELNNPNYDFGNYEPGTLIIEKDVVPDDASSWNFQVSGPNSYGANSNASEGNSLPLGNLLAGSYAITETQQGGYELIDISCDVKYGRVGNSVEVYVGPGEEVTCTFTNEKNILDVSIDKSNDKPDSTFVGETVTYTLVVTNNGNRILLDPQIIDVLPGGFEYVAGSTTVEGLPFADPTEVNGKLVWDLALWGIKPQTSLTLVYQATIGDDVADGVHTNLATCKAMYEREERIREGDLWIECNIDDSSVTIGSVLDISAGVEPQVLGIKTELPAAGNDTELMMGIMLAGALGFVFKLVSRKLYEEDN